MGGNLYNFPRTPKEEYFKIKSEIKPILDLHFGDRYRIPKAYHSKESYGDMDILVDAGILQNKEWIKPLQADLGVTEIIRVRNVVSMSYKGLQVDFFLIGTSKLECAYNFMSYNILGNLIGRIFHKFNLKYGEEGLHYVLRTDDNHISKEILLSRDMRKILEFLELDYSKWERGFDNIEEIYHYIYNCKYFTSSSYKKNNAFLKKKSERPEFLEFIKYVEDKEDKNYPFRKDKETYIAHIDQYFPEVNLPKKYSQHIEKMLILKKISEKFNGNLIMDLIPELKNNGIVLGKFIGDFKKKITDDEFDSYIIETDQEEINNTLIQHYNDFK